jgi:transcriptional regulator with XRE-family HTH domain
MNTKLVEQVKMYTGVGLSQKQIAATLGIAKLAVSIIQRQEGISPRPRNYRLALSLEVIEKILELYVDHGAPFIAKELGLPTHQVYLILKAKGAPRPEKRSGRVGGRYIGERLALAAKKGAISERRDRFERELAEEFKVSLGWLRAFLRRRRS